MNATTLADVERQLLEGGPTVPKGARLISYDMASGTEVWHYGGEHVTVGNLTEDDTEHDCDAMGCGSMTHVLSRVAAR